MRKLSQGFILFVFTAISASGFDLGAKTVTGISVNSGISYTFGSSAASLFDSKNGLTGGTYSLTWDLSRDDSGVHMELAIPNVGNGVSSGRKLLQSGYGWMILGEGVKILTGVAGTSPWTSLDDVNASYVTAEKGMLQVQFFPKEKFHFGASYQFPIEPGASGASHTVLGTSGSFPDFFAYSMQADLQHDVGFHQGFVSLSLLGLGDWSIRSGAHWNNREVQDGNVWIFDTSFSYQLDPKVAVGTSGAVTLYGPVLGDALGYSLRLTGGLPLDINWFWGLSGAWVSTLADPVTKLMSQQLATATVATALGYALETGTSLSLGYAYTMSAGPTVYLFGSDWFENKVTLDARWTY